MEFRVNITLEVDQVGNALAIKTPVPMQLVYQGGQWKAQCESPPVATLRFDSLQEAIVAGAKEAAAEIQAAVNERPCVVGRVTPGNIPDELR